jgi:hypothetical protein
MPWVDVKRVSPWEALLISTTVTAAVKARRAVRLREKCVQVPCRFCEGVWVGWRTRMAWVVRSTALELRSYRRGMTDEARNPSISSSETLVPLSICQGPGLTGWGEKKISLCENTPYQTAAAI